MPVYMPREKKPVEMKYAPKCQVPELLSWRDFESIKNRTAAKLPPELAFKTAAAVGMVEGFGDCLNDSAELVCVLIAALVRDDVLGGARSILTELGGLSLGDLKEAGALMGAEWMNRLASPNPWESGRCAGYLIGYMLCEACIAAATSGYLTMLKGARWGTGLGGKIKGLRLVKNVEKKIDMMSLVLRRGGDDFEEVLRGILKHAGDGKNGKRIMRYLAEASEVPGWEKVARDLALGGNKFTGAEWVLRYIDDRGLWKKVTAFELRTETGTGLRVYDAWIDKVKYEFKSWKSMNARTFLEQVSKDYEDIIRRRVKWVFENKGGLAASKDELIEKLKKVLDNAAGSEYLTLRQIDKLKNQLHLFVEFR